jgi:hypothetical protein
MAMDSAAEFDGIKVLDLSSVLMGPLVAQMLGDMSAHVVKIEAPEGDIAGTTGPARLSSMASLLLALVISFSMMMRPPSWRPTAPSWLRHRCLICAREFF